VTAFLKADQLAKMSRRSTTARVARGLQCWAYPWRCFATTIRSRLRRIFKLTDLLQKFDKCFGATGRNYGKVTGDRTIDDIEKRRRDRWNFLFIAGMWFQDLFNYDFRRTEQCIILTLHRKARSASAPTTPVWVGETLSRRCT